MHIAEGDDLVMIKPALAYLDVIRRVKDATGWPVCAYHVSGEYAMIEAAAERGWLDGPRAHAEALTAIRRAGADLVISYYARQYARAQRGRPATGQPGAARRWYRRWRTSCWLRAAVTAALLQSSAHRMSGALDRGYAST